jgi:hypothetical protein
MPLGKRLTESDSEAKYKLEQRIQDCEAELQKIEEELRA